MIEVTSACLTDRGHVRDHNEDSVLAVPGVYAVADGLGGHAAGDVASRIAVEELAGLAARDGGPVADEDAVRDALDAANAKVRALRDDSGAPLGAGTTVSAVVEVTRDGAPAWLVLNIGDSRVYRFADGELEQVSVDHSLVQELVDEGLLSRAGARRHPQRNVITRALGTSAREGADSWVLPATPGERLLLCTDGLTGEVEDEEIRAILAAEPDPQRAAQRLVDAALEAGGHDNVSVVLVDVLPPAP